ncbi:rRNA maturation RNase YbeY [bacterium]|nr:rRNA maturation RNase YbeY [bacterium]|tara:strand:+ start:2448 stop:2864 length:417 start_codon:yes stop_codon:yes gene_type:complete
MNNKVLVFPLEKKYKRHAAYAQKTADACFLVLGKESVRIEIYIIGNKRMQELNKKFRKKDRQTNVLSFKEPENIPSPEAEKMLGEIYLAPDYIQKEGGDIGHLTIHGILHLLGYTHEGLRDKIKMEKKEKSVLKKIQD